MFIKSVFLTQRVHPFPFRTRKLSFAVPKILGWRRPGKIGHSRHKGYFKYPFKYSSLAQSVERMTVNHDVAGSSPAGGARKKTVTKVTVFFQRCVPQAERDVSFGSEVRFAREVCLRHVIRNTSHHCDHREQHHYAKHNITLA